MAVFLKLGTDNVCELTYIKKSGQDVNFPLHVIISGIIVIYYVSVGISGKSQVLFALVFTTRYLDLFTVFISPYNTVMKVSV